MTIPPLNTSEIGVFAWYEHGAIFSDVDYANLHAQLSDKTSESPDEYYSGTYIYNSVTYSIRIRKDGFVLSWLDNTTNPGMEFGYGAGAPYAQGSISSIMSAASVTGFDYAKCSYYNFAYPTATTVQWFGKSFNGEYDIDRHYYFTVPVDLTILYHMMRYYLGVQGSGGRPYSRIYVNSTLVVSQEGDYGSVSGIIDISSYLLPQGSQNDIRCLLGYLRSFSRTVQVFYHK